MVRVVDADGVFPCSREKVWQLIQAHQTDAQTIHPGLRSIKPLRKEGNADVIEQVWDMGGQTARIVAKTAASPPDRLTIEFLEGPMTGKMINTYTTVPSGTKVVTECDMKSQFMNDQQLEGAIRQFLNQAFDEDCRYLSKMK